MVFSGFRFLLNNKRNFFLEKFAGGGLALTFISAVRP
jgi:hypothetical protein